MQTNPDFRPRPFRLTALLAPVLAMLLLALAVAPSHAQQAGTLRVGGSTTLLPAVSTAASDFMEKYSAWNAVDPSLGEEPIVVFVTGGGSSFGVKSAMNGTVDIGMASRDLKQKEIDKLGEHTTWLVGKDAVSFAVATSSPMAKILKSLTAEELARILSGEVTKWNQVNKKLPNEQIVLYVRDSGAGSAEIVQDVIMGKTQISKDAIQVPSQGALLQRLKSNKNAIGYISSGLVEQSEGELTAISLGGIAPSNENVINGSYPLARPLLLLVQGKPGAQAKAFIEYVTNEGQAIVAKQGYVPAKQAASASR